MPLKAALFDENEPTPGSAPTGRSPGRPDLGQLFGGDDGDDDLALLRSGGAAGARRGDAAASSWEGQMQQDDGFEFLLREGAGHGSRGQGWGAGSRPAGGAGGEPMEEPANLWHSHDDSAMLGAMSAIETGSGNGVEEAMQQRSEEDALRVAEDFQRLALHPEKSQDAPLIAPRDSALLAETEPANSKELDRMDVVVGIGCTTMPGCAGDEGTSQATDLTPAKLGQRAVPLPGPWCVLDLPRYSLQNTSAEAVGAYMIERRADHESTTRVWQEIRASGVALIKAHPLFREAAGVA